MGGVSKALAWILVRSLFISDISDTKGTETISSMTSREIVRASVLPTFWMTIVGSMFSDILLRTDASLWMAKAISRHPTNKAADIGIHGSITCGTSPVLLSASALRGLHLHIMTDDAASRSLDGLEQASDIVVLDLFPLVWIWWQTDLDA